MQLCTLTMLIGGCAVTAAQIDERNVAGSPDTNSIPTSLFETRQRVPISPLSDPDHVLNARIARKFGLDMREVSSTAAQTIEALMNIANGPATQVGDGQLQIPTTAVPLEALSSVTATLPSCADFSVVPAYVPDIDQNGSRILRLVVGVDCGEAQPSMTATEPVPETSGLAAQPTSSKVDVLLSTTKTVSSISQTLTLQPSTSTVTAYALVSSKAQTSISQLETSIVTAHASNRSTSASPLTATNAASRSLSTSEASNAYSTYQSEESSGNHRLQIATSAVLMLSVLMALLLF